MERVSPDILRTFLVGWGEENGGKDTRHKNHKWQVQNRQGKVKNSMGNGKAEELICMTHGDELR